MIDYGIHVHAKYLSSLLDKNESDQFGFLEQPNSCP